MRLRRLSAVFGERRSSLVGLAVVTVIFVALSTVIALQTPAWEHSDEPDHVRNIETLVGGHWYRIRYDGAVGDEAHQPPLYYGLLAALQKITGQAPRTVNPGPSNFLSASHGVFPRHRRADHDFLLLLRLPNVLLGIATIMLTFLAARMLSPDPWTPVLAAGTVGFLPGFVFLSAFVTNDNLVNMLAALLTVVALWCLASPSTARLIALGAVLGLIVITKLSALPLVVVLLVVAAYRRGWPRRAEAVLIMAGAAALVCGWYLIQNSVRYGDPLASAATTRYLQPIGGLGTLGQPYVIADPLRLIFSQVPTRIFDGFWYTSGWNQFRWPAVPKLIAWLALAGALAGAIWPGRPRLPIRGAWTVLVVLMLSAFASVWIVAFGTNSYEARLAYVGLPALACLSALGLQRWSLPIRWAPPILLLAGSVVALQQDVLSVSWF